MIEEAISETLERMNENKSEEGKEKEMKTGDKFIIELGERIEKCSAYMIKDMDFMITEKDLKKLEKYKGNNDGKENIKYVTPEMFEKVNISTGEGMKKFQEEKCKEQTEKKDSVAGKKFVIEIEEETEACIFEMKGTNERFFETACKIKGTDAYIAKTDLDKLKKYKEKKDDEAIKVGDEIESSEQIEKAVVLWIEADGYWGCLQNNLFFTVNDKQKKYWKKTGKHYDEVEKIFQKLKEKKPKFKVGDKVKYKTNGGWYNYGVIEELYEKRCLIKITDKISGIEYMSISYNNLILDDRKEGEIPFL